MDFGKKRWICYIASLLLVVCAGFQYSLSVFQIPLDNQYGWGIPEIAFAYSVLCVAETIMVIFFTGRIQSKLGIRKFLILGGLFFGGGTLLCAFMVGSVFELYLYQGIMVGIGHAIIYPCLTAYVIQLVPERAGLSSGLGVALYACGPLVWAPLSAYICTSVGDVSVAFRVIGIALLVLIVGLSLLLEDVPEGYQGAGAAASEKARQTPRTMHEFSRKEMVKRPVFYMFYLTFFVGILGGMMLLTQGATIFEHGLNLSATLAASMLGVLSICNACGRLLFGALFDKIKPTAVMLLLFALYVFAFGAMAFANVTQLVIAAACLSMVCFGGFAAFLAPMTSQLFGIKHLTENFSLMFTIYSLAGFAAPVLVANIRAVSGGYFSVFLFATVLSLLGLICGVFLKRTIERQMRAASAPALEEELVME